MRNQSSTDPELAGTRLDSAYRQYLPEIVRYLSRRLGDAVAADAAADVFLRAAGAKDPEAVTLPWLYGVAANVIHERRRSERRRLRAMQRLAAQTQPQTTDRHLEGPTLSPALMAALRKLAAADRETLLLVAWGELSYQQTAEALQIPIGTVRSRLARARGQLALSASTASPKAQPLTTPRTSDV